MGVRESEGVRVGVGVINEVISEVGENPNQNKILCGAESRYIVHFYFTTCVFFWWAKVRYKKACKR